ncbi:MAG: selenoprotein [bacterium]|nr:selenoprotein [bacterium]
MPHAAGLAEAIKNEIGVEAKLIEGGGGIFDVKANGDMIYSKDETGRFPEHNEVLDRLASR